MKQLRIHSYHGMSLCSQRDPRREAALWNDHVLAGNDADQYWVIGLGAGYHIEEMVRRKPKAMIAVIDFRKEVVESFLDWGKGLSGQVLTVSVNQPVDILTSRAFEIIGFSLPPVLTFLPAVQGLGAEVRAIENHLLGKSTESFSLFANHFKINFSGRSHPMGRGEPVTIKSIDALFGGLDSSEEKKSVSLLRELVR